MISRARSSFRPSRSAVRDTPSFGQTPFRRQGLAGLEHAVQDQALDALGHFVRHLAGFLRFPRTCLLRTSGMTKRSSGTIALHQPSVSC